MAFELTDLAALAKAPFDDIIDVRSPAEFAKDHLPGAINLPVLSNEERAEVGKIYVQEAPFRARKIGAALVLRNTAQHIDTTLAGKKGDWQPLVYCWRGGQRSGTFGWLLREIGWRSEVLRGGYRSFRRAVVGMLYERPLPQRFIVLAGMTCTAKTELLCFLSKEGHQVIDLEALAQHRGSVFGAREVGQPSQKLFESRLALELSDLDPARPVLLEAESSKIGDLLVPPQLWQAMCQAPRVSVSAPMGARAAYFLRAYPDLVADPERFQAKLSDLIPHHGRAKTDHWKEMVAEGAFEAVATALMSEHYDPRYAKSSARFANLVQKQIALPGLGPDELAAATSELTDAIAVADRSGQSQSGGALDHTPDAPIAQTSVGQRG